MAEEYTYFELVEHVLEGAKSKPMTSKKIWNEAENQGLVAKLKKAKNPSLHSLRGALSSKKADKLFTKIDIEGSPTKFCLKSEDSLPEESAAVTGTAAAKTKKATFFEKDLHPLLACFANADKEFKYDLGRRGIRTKTINAAKTRRKDKKKQKNLMEWVHPDMVGVYFPFGDEGFCKDLIGMNNSVSQSLIRLYSFELKRELKKGDYKLACAQAACNSSWAHEGYLVAPNIDKNADFLSDLKRLSSAFGIGLISLDLEKIYSSRILSPARSKEYLDFTTMNLLSSENSDFNDFIKSINQSCGVTAVLKDKFDKIIPNPDKYAKKLAKLAKEKNIKK